MAQQAEQSGGQVLERIDVTGSYIRRTDTETPSNVQSISNDEIRRTGYTNLAEVLNNITANGQGTLSQGFSGAFAEGACGIALRGMTVGATLVLLDGHRMAPYPLADDGQRSFVDICSLPLDAVDHVDVLKDGASATYGSDAIAGVVNVVLKKSYKGATISAENGWSQRGGGQTSHLTGMVGFGDLDESGKNAYFSVEYRHTDPIALAQRPYLNKLDFTSQGGQNLIPGANNTASPVGTPTPASNTGYFINPNPTVPVTFSNFGYLPGCNATAATNNQCEIPTNWLYITPPTQNLNLLGRGSMKFGDNWLGTLTASLFQSEVFIAGSPYSTGVSGYSNVGVGPGPNHTSIATLTSTPGPFQAPLPANIAAQFGVAPNTLAPINILTGDLGGQDTAIKNNTYRLTAELRGTAAGWDIDGAWGWSNDVMTITQTGFPIYNVLYNDLANGTYFPNTGNSANVLNSIAPAIISTNQDSIWFTGLHGSRDLFALPGGNLGVAVGADFFFRSLQAVPAPLSTSGQQAQNFAYAEGSQSDWSGFAEVSAPILKSLEVDGSIRHDKYNTYSPGDWTPKIGFKFTPIQEVAFRGTYSQGFRAPNPVESQSSIAAGYYGNFPDPILCPSGNKNAVGSYSNQCSIPEVFGVGANPALKPETSISKTLGIILEPTKWVNLSVDWYDITLNNQIYPASEDSSFVPQPVRGAPQPQPYVSAPGVTITQTPPVGNFLYYDIPYININSTEVKGLEFGIKNKFSLGDYGKLRADFMWTHTIHYYFNQPGLGGGSRVDVAGTHGPNEISGDTGNPRNRAKWVFTWEKGPYEVQATVNYISGNSVTDPSAISSANPNGQLTCQASINTATEFGGTTFFPGAVPSNVCHVASFTEVGLYSNWQIDKHWSIHGSIDNLFDRQAPLDLQTYAAPNYNPSLHMSGAIGRFYTVGGRFVF